MHHLRKRNRHPKSDFVSAYLVWQRWFLDLFLSRHLSKLSPHDIRRGRVVVALLIFGILAMSGMAVVRFSTEGIAPAPVVVAFGVLAIVASLVYFVRTDKSGVAGDLLILGVVTVIFVTAIHDNGLYSRVLTWLPSLLLIANFTAARLTAIRTTLLVLVGLLLLLAAQEMQWIVTSYSDDSPLGRLAAGFGSMLFVSAIAYAYEDSRRQADDEHEALIRTRNTERLVSLVNDVLDVERLSSGRFELHLKPIDLGSVVDEAVRTQQYLADGRQVRLSTRIESLSTAQADYDRLLQVVQNLLSNAIKFSHSGGEVEVYLDKSESRIVCEVRDRGVGVSEAFREQLFERFAQEMSGTRRYSGGSGLGLFICRGIIDLHGGRIGYRAREGGGSVFHFEIPET